MLASFPTFTKTGRNVCISFATSFTPQPKLIHLLTMPSGVTAPGTPIPTPATSETVRHLFSNIFRICAATSDRIRLPLSCLSVGISDFSSSSPFSVNNPHFTVVPPISMPKRTLFIIIISPHEIFLYSAV